MEIKDGEEITIPLKIYIDGPDTTNAYQAMIFGFNTELKLTQVVEE
jgi:hypothetical protein